MLSTDDLFNEIKIMEEVYNKETDSYKKAMLKAEILNLKMQQSLRFNLVTIMKHFKIENTPKRKLEHGQKKEFKNPVLK